MKYVCTMLWSIGFKLKFNIGSIGIEEARQCSLCTAEESNQMQTPNNTSTYNDIPRTRVPKIDTTRRQREGERERECCCAVPQ